MAVAHERELGHALLGLRAQFDRWERGEISADDLNDLVHQFHQDPSREIWKRAAVAADMLRREELPDENIAQADALLFGRVTYELMEAAWREFL